MLHGIYSTFTHSGRSDTAMDGELHPSGPTAGGLTRQTSLFKRMNDALYVFITSMSCIINYFHKTINSISGEVTRERIKPEYKYTGTGLIACLDVAEVQSVRHSEVQISPQSNKESLHISQQALGEGDAENLTSHIDYMEQQGTPIYMAALILSFNKSNTLPCLLAVAK